MFIGATSIVISVGVMLFAAQAIGDYVEQHPTLKMLALSFLLLIGTSLIADGLGFHIPKGYIYFAMGFSVLVETLNLRARGARSSRRVSGRPASIAESPADSS